MPAHTFIQLFVLTCITGIFPVSAFAQCSIEEVEFFLEKGFSQEQITTLCSTASDRDCLPCPKENKSTQQGTAGLCSTVETGALDCSACPQSSVMGNEEGALNKQDDEARDKVVVRDQGSRTQKEYDAIQALKIGGDVLSFDATSTELIFVKSICTFSGDAIQRGRRKEFCHGVKYTVSRQNLQARPGKTVPIIGTLNALITGEVTLELSGSINDYPYQVRKQLEAYINKKKTENKAEFPARRGVSVDHLVQAFRTLSL